MTTKIKYKTGAFEAIHSSARALHKVGGINKATMRDFDVACLTTPVEINPARSRKFES